MSPLCSHKEKSKLIFFWRKKNVGLWQAQLYEIEVWIIGHWEHFMVWCIVMHGKRTLCRIYFTSPRNCFQMKPYYMKYFCVNIIQYLTIRMISKRGYFHKITILTTSLVFSEELCRMVNFCGNRRQQNILKSTIDPLKYTSNFVVVLVEARVKEIEYFSHPDRWVPGAQDLRILLACKRIKLIFKRTTNYYLILDSLTLAIFFSKFGYRCSLLG